MIRIQRPATVPSVLATEGSARRAEHEGEFDSDPSSYQSGAKRFVFDRSVYGDATVKGALIGMQYSKCAFCEAKPLHVSSGDVEHLRPKAESRQQATAPVSRPGYYWLAYEWENLLFACERCNRRHKKSEFPLRNPSLRALNHHMAITDETPLFVDPSREDPQQHISFRDHVPVPANHSDRGRITIAALGLSRPELNRDREEHLERLRLLEKMTQVPNLPESMRAEARDLLRRATQSDAEYALMCQTALSTA